MISIHEALANLDVIRLPRALLRSYFNPRGSREPRPNASTLLRMRTLFQSTRLSRTSTVISVVGAFVAEFQSTRLSRTSTHVRNVTDMIRRNFNPRGSREPRPQTFPNSEHFLIIFLCKSTKYGSGTYAKNQIHFRFSTNLGANLPRNPCSLWVRTEAYPYSVLL